MSNPKPSSSERSYQPRKASFHEEGKTPIHTVFFYNLNYNLPYSEFEDFAKEFGEYSHIHSIIEKKGQAFVTYFDIRNAQRAVSEGRTRKLCGREVGTNFAFNGRREQSSGTVLVKASASTTLTDIGNAMTSLGEISSLNSGPLQGQFLVTYFDTRNAKAAADHSGAIKANGDPIIIELQQDPYTQGGQAPSQNILASPSFYPSPINSTQVSPQPYIDKPQDVPMRETEIPATYYSPSDPRAPPSGMVQVPPAEAARNALEKLRRLNQDIQSKLSEKVKIN